jgi:cytochrome c oxidase assembly protein subunit 11
MTSPAPPLSSETLKQKNLSLLISLVGVFAGMLMLSYAAVPLYSMFCRITGYGGTTSIRADSPTVILPRQVRVSFNTDVAPALPWSFTSLQREINIRIGERHLAFFEARNESDQPVTATATFNVTPFKTGQYFVKLQCFCFNEQRLEPGEKAVFPVSFYVDPALNDDKNLDDIKNITLSYTFFPVKP